MRSPLFWLALAYAAGLALFHQVDDSPRLLFLFAAAALLAGGLTLWRRWLRLTLVCALAGFFLAGGATIRLVAEAVPPDRVDRLVENNPIDLSEAVRLTGWLRRHPEQKPLFIVYELELEALEQGGRRYQTSGGVRLGYFESPHPKLPPEPVPELRYGERVEVLVRVHRPINRGTPGSFDWRGYLARRGIFLEGSLKSFLLLKKLPGRRGNRVFGGIQNLRAHLLERLDQLLPLESHRDRNAILRAMLLGDRSFLSHRQKQAFRWSGAYHVLVVSGLHTAMIAFFIFWLVRRASGSESVATFVTLPALVFYLLLVEDRPPIERAVWMVSLYLLARLLFRQVHLANPVSLAALVVLFAHPLWLFEPSFHLSFGAVFLIAFFALPWIERTSEPYRNALGFLDAEERDEQLRPPHLVQFRLDLRLLAALVSGVAFWARDPERGARALLARLIRIGLRAWDFFLLSFAIHLGFVLLTAFYFKRVIWAGLLTNLLVVPLVSLIVPLGLAALLLGLLWLPAGALPAAMVGTLIGLLLWLAETIAGAGLSYGIPPPPLWLVVLYLGALVLLGVAVTRQRLQRWAGLALAALVLVVATYPFSPQAAEQALEVVVLDVGQGDSIFLAFPNGETWLVDAGRGPLEVGPGYQIGEAAGETLVVPFLRQRGLKRLDRVWLTHAHHDHMGGLPAVLEEFGVGSFHVGRNPPSARYQELLEEVRRRGIPIERHQAGEHFAVGGVEVQILWPAADYEPGPEPSNNDSLVLRLCLPAAAALPHCLLLPGDIEVEVEKRLAQGTASLQAEVLKVPHHGGRDAASQEFLQAVDPDVAILSVSATNPFGHPFERVLGRLRVEADELYRTDQDGSVTVRLETDGFQVATYRQRQRRELYPNLWAQLAACARRLLSLESF